LTLDATRGLTRPYIPQVPLPPPPSPISLLLGSGLPAGGDEDEVTAFTVFSTPAAAARVWADIGSMNGVLKVQVVVGGVTYTKMG